MDVGGAEQQVLVLAGALRDRGWDARIVSLVPLGPIGLQAREQGIPTDSLQMPRGVPDPRGVARLFRLVRSWKPDILHSHMVHANLMGRMVRHGLRVPVAISTIHSLKDGGRLRLLGYRLTDGLAELTTIVSEAAAERYLRTRAVSRDRLRVVPNGVDTRRFRAVPDAREAIRRELNLEQAFVWLAVGRFEVPKDYPNMLRAFARVRARHPGAILLLAGKGSLQSEVEALASSLSIGDAVRFLGVRRDVPELMSASDGYVLSSAWEGMPMALLEAASVGLAVVATDVGGNREVLVAEQARFLVPAGDSAALSDAMERLMALPANQRLAMGERSRAYVESRFSLERVVDLWEELYRGLLAAKGRKIERPGRAYGDAEAADTSGKGFAGQR